MNQDDVKYCKTLTFYQIWTRKKSGSQTSSCVRNWASLARWNMALAGKEQSWRRWYLEKEVGGWSEQSLCEWVVMRAAFYNRPAPWWWWWLFETGSIALADEVTCIPSSVLMYCSLIIVIDGQLLLAVWHLNISHGNETEQIFQ